MKSSRDELLTQLEKAFREKREIAEKLKVITAASRDYMARISITGYESHSSGVQPLTTKIEVYHGSTTDKQIVAEVLKIARNKYNEEYEYLCDKIDSIIKELNCEKEEDTEYAE